MLDFIFLICLIVCSVTLNLLVIVVLVSSWRHLHTKDRIVLSLAVSDLLQGLVGFPYLLVDYDKPASAEPTRLCRVSAFVVTFTAVTSITHITALFIKYWLTITRPFWSEALELSRKRTLWFTVPSWLYGIVWAAFPLLGWSSYGKETDGSYRCGMNLREHTLNVISYNLTLAVAAFLVPIVIIVYCSTRIVVAFRSMNSDAVKYNGALSRMTHETRRQLIRQYVMIGVMIIAFTTAWTPYTILAILNIAQADVSYNTHDTAAILAKTASVYNPIIYSIAYREFKVKLSAWWRRACWNYQKPPSSKAEKFAVVVTKRTSLIIHDLR